MKNDYEPLEKNWGQSIRDALEPEPKLDTKPIQNPRRSDTGRGGRCASRPDRPQTRGGFSLGK